MNEKIKELLGQISEIELEIDEILQEKREHILYLYEDGKIQFKKEIEEAHKKMKITLFRYILDSDIRNILSAPFIYSMIIPFVILDVTITLYQIICFRLYRLNKVNRSSYVVIDRHLLKHLNSIEQLNCAYCGYGNGVLAYAREVAAKTEQYWCPIKHARNVFGRHSRYYGFLDYGDAEKYHEHLVEYRNKLKVES